MPIDNDVLQQYIAKGMAGEASKPAEGSDKTNKPSGEGTTKNGASAPAEASQKPKSERRKAVNPKGSTKKPSKPRRPRREPGAADATEAPRDKASFSDNRVPSELVDKAQKAVKRAYEQAGGTRGKMSQSDAVSVVLASALNIPSNEPYLPRQQSAVLEQYYQGISETDTLRAIRMQLQANTETVARLNRQVQVLQMLVAMLVCDRFAIHDPATWNPDINAVGDIAFEDPATFELLDAARTALGNRGHREQMMNNPNRRRG